MNEKSKMHFKKVPFVKNSLSFRRRRDIMGPAATAAHQQQLNEDHRQALVLFSIVIIFLVTNSPRILINIDEVRYKFFNLVIFKN